MLRWSLCDYSDAYILVSETIIITGAGANDAAEIKGWKMKEIKGKYFKIVHHSLTS